jgi:hypothetical protein
MLNQSSITPWRRMGEWIYRSTFSWPRHYLEVSGQLHAHAALPLGKEPPVSIGSEVGWARAGLDYVEKILNPTGTRNQTRSQSLSQLPTWKNSSEINRKECFVDVDWIKLAKDRDEWQALVNTVDSINGGKTLHQLSNCKLLRDSVS